MQKRDAKETILRYAAEDLLNFRFFTLNYGFIYARLKVLSTKRGCFVDKKHFGWELSTQEGPFVDKVNDIADSETKRCHIVPEHR